MPTPLLTHPDYPYAFDPSACAVCQGRCCTGESGYIFASMGEFTSIADHLGIDMTSFIADYLVKVKNRFSIRQLRVGESHDCLFFDRSRNGCSIYEVRPLQCRTFPFWEYFQTHLDELLQECPGIKKLSDAGL